MASGFKAYPFDEIEKKWQTYWADHRTFRSPDPGEPGGEKPKYYVLADFIRPKRGGSNGSRRNLGEHDHHVNF